MRHTGLLVLATGLALDSPCLLAVDKPSLLEDDTIRITEKGMAAPGSPIHAWITAHAKGARADTPIAYSFTFKDSASVGMMDSIHRYDSTSQKKTVVLFDGPPPPGWIPPAPGASATTTACGYPVSHATQTGTATIEFNWEFRNTGDSDNDGESDADPAWVLVGYRATNVELGTTTPPLQC